MNTPYHSRKVISFLGFIKVPESDAEVEIRYKPRSYDNMRKIMERRIIQCTTLLMLSFNLKQIISIPAEGEYKSSTDQPKLIKEQSRDRGEKNTCFGQKV